MARNETKVRVRLDTRRAKGELQGLVRESTRTAGKVAGGISAAIGRGIGMVGVGGAIATGMGVIKGATSSGISDVLGESLGGLGARISDFMLGDLSPEARASKYAREQAVQAGAMQAGLTKQIPPGLKGFYDATKSMRLDYEKGKKIIEMDPGFRDEELIDKTVDRFGKVLADALTSLMPDALKPVASIFGALSRMNY